MSALFITTGCSDDNTLKTTPATPGKEITFGANASIEDGNAKTRTIYGDKGTDFQVINWEPNDHIRIVCAQAAQNKEADYKITEITAGSTTTGKDKESKGATLTKVSNGLQWGTGEHTFYAVYPSPGHFTGTEVNQPRTEITNNLVSGVLPTTQTVKELKSNYNGYKYVAMPNMDNAYMVARNVYNTETNGGEGVTLHFKPIVTAIEVEIKAGTIHLNSTDNELRLTSVSLSSLSKKDICGSFSANLTGLNTDEKLINGVTVNNTNTTSGDHNRVTIDLNDKNIVLSEDESCVVTFFILPTAEFDEANTDLKLTVFYTSEGVATSKVCTLGKEVRAHKKYFFSNLTLPDIATNSNSSNWFGALGDDIYVSQLSIPGAGNAGSYNYTGSNPELYKEQTLSLKQQWDLGVRCFELLTDRQKASTGNLLSKVLTCNDTGVGITYETALNTLTNLLKADPKETLIIISSYQPSAEGNTRDCAIYMSNLNNTFSSGSYNGVQLYKWGPETTVSEIRGKMSIISRISQEGEDEVVKVNTTAPTWLTYIKGWGSLKDKWNRRFGDEYYPGYKQSKGFASGLKNVEDRLWKEEHRATGLNSWETSIANPSGYPTSSPNFLYDVDGGGNAWVQEWMRVSPGIDYKEVSTYKLISTLGKLYFHWPESYTEKKSNIISTFVSSKNETGNTLYINSLCGYFISDSDKNSYSPFANNFEAQRYTYSNGEIGGGGKGGDFASYNNRINNEIYSYVLEQVNNNDTGPMGIVMMDYIGNGTGGTNLPNLILQNNFKFPLRKKITSREDADYDASYTDGGNAIE